MAFKNIKQFAVGAFDRAQEFSSTARELLSGSTRQNHVHYPRDQEDFYEVLNILRQRLPSELVLEVLGYAQYWVPSHVSISKEVVYREDDCRDRPLYLISDPIQGERARVGEIRVEISSHDQGWSSYPEDRGTLRNSWTWFDLGIERSPDREKIPDCRKIATNLHATSKTNRHRIVFRTDEDLPGMSLLRSGDCISIIPRALFPGWSNHVESASIEIYTDYTGGSGISNTARSM